MLIIIALASKLIYTVAVKDNQITGKHSHDALKSQPSPPGQTIQPTVQQIPPEQHTNFPTKPVSP